MTTTSFITSFRFDRGLETVFELAGDDIALPPPSSLRPPQIQFTEQIQALLNPPRIDDFLFSRLQPHVTDNLLLTPQSFRRVLDDVATKLKVNPSLTVGREALQIIEADLAMRDLLTMNRTALLQG